jgi:hypothetical protein
MRRLLAGAAVTAAALAAAGVAVAHLSTTGTSQVAATFSATTAERFTSKTCTGADGQYEILDATYDGTAASSDTDLAGTVSVRITSVYNTTRATGSAGGWLEFHNDSGRNGAVRFDAVNAGGKLTGFVRGRSGRPSASLIGSFTADFSKGGIVNGQLGGGGSAPNVAVLAGKPCTGSPGKSVKLTVKGTVTSITSAAVTVAPEDGSPPQTCAIGHNSPNTRKLAKGDRVEMTCATLNGTLTLVRLGERD